MCNLWPDPTLASVEIRGADINLVPLDPARHAASLFALFQDDNIWRYLRDGPFETLDMYRSHLWHFLSHTAFAAYVIVEKTSGAILGKVSLMHADPKCRSLEIGYVVFGAKATGHPFGKQAISLLIDAVFTQFDCKICKWRCDARNIASAKLSAKFFFTHSATIHRHLLIKGVHRDTKIFQLKRNIWKSLKNK